MSAREQAAEFVFKDWLEEGVRGMRDTLRRRPRLLPEEFRTHMRNARKEVLLAFRSLLDAAIERTEAQPRAKKKATKIKVE